jgi:TonB family protein
MAQRVRLSLALLVSASLHAAILSTLAPGVPAMIPGIPGDAMRVTLIAPHKSVSNVRATPYDAAARQETPVDPRDDAQRDRKVVALARLTASDSSQITLPDASDRDADTVTITARTLQTMLHEAFVVHFRYPPLARQNGWQGEVRLGLRIEPNGKLARIRIISSSGYGILDSAALHSLQAVDRLPHAAILLKGSGLNLILPVRYQLLDS